jgi:hypothetical protein
MRATVASAAGDADLTITELKAAEWLVDSELTHKEGVASRGVVEMRASSWTSVTLLELVVRC